MNLPNKLTFLRILMVPLILLFLIPIDLNIAFISRWNDYIADYGKIIAFVLFGLASLTDLFDGLIARRHNLVTNLGKFLDPIADKMLVISVLIALVQQNRINAIVTIIVIIREFIITGIRLLASDKGVVIAANNLGKAKTVSQVVAILVILGEPVLEWLFALFTDPQWAYHLGNITMLVAVILTLVSGINYIKQNKTCFRG